MKGDCPCGSGWTKHGVFDSKNTFITSGCKSCLPKKLKGYREDVLYGPDYDTLERELYWWTKIFSVPYKRMKRLGKFSDD